MTASHEAAAIDRLTAAVLALAVTVELQGPDPPSIRYAHQNVEDRFGKAHNTVREATD